MHKKIFSAISALGLVMTAQIASAAPHYNVDDYYQVYKEGRIYVFDDYKTYNSFNEVGETAFRLTRIGAGPKRRDFSFWFN
ncbi:MAG: hypothetical protein KAQ91_05780 [Methylococcales bacterium]|nr:hypothetical protein [Methylococcales bacterium]